VVARLLGKWTRGWLLGWRNVTRAADERTTVAAIIPYVGIGHSFPLVLPQAHPIMTAVLAAFLSSFALDYLVRQKMGGANLTFSVLKQIPIPPVASLELACPWNKNITITEWACPRVLELTYTAWDLVSFARDIGYSGAPFGWDPERRFMLRCELDAACFHLYGISHEDANYILDTFRLVRMRDEKQHGEYRTKRLILDAYNRIAAAMAGGEPFATLLDPPPGRGPTHPDRDPSNGGIR
jgi:hypothetical protein